SQAHIDLSGTFIANSSFNQTFGIAQSGTVLPGGTISFDTSIGMTGSGDLPGFVIAESGASIDVSGAGATIIGRSTGRGGLALTPVPSWSDAGTVSVNAGDFLW